jgi:hypothetical protein
MLHQRRACATHREKALSMKKNLIAFAVLVLLAAPAARADDWPVARLVGVSGNVLVSNDFNIASAGEALHLVPGMRIIATMNSSATVEFRDGCRVKVGGGERLEIRSEGPCVTRAVRNGVATVAVQGARP